MVLVLVRHRESKWNLIFGKSGAQKENKELQRKSPCGCFTPFVCSVCVCAVGALNATVYKMWELVCGLGFSIDWIICGQKRKFHHLILLVHIPDIWAFSISLSRFVCVRLNLYSIFAFIERHRIGIKIRVHLCSAICQTLNQNANKRNHITWCIHVNYMWDD